MGVTTLVIPSESETPLSLKVVVANMLRRPLATPMTRAVIVADARLAASSSPPSITSGIVSGTPPVRSVTKRTPKPPSSLAYWRRIASTACSATWKPPPSR